MSRPHRLEPPRLLAISDRKAQPGESLHPWLRDLAQLAKRLEGSGLSERLAVQVREKDLDDRDLFELVRQARRLLPPAISVLVNGRPDIALAAGIEGVHLPSAGLPAPRVVERWGDRLLVGVSTHHESEVEAARRAGATYVTFGPVWPTPSKAAYGPPPGLSGLRRASRIGVPVLALGGTDGSRLPAALAAGAWGLAGIRCFAAPELAEATLRSSAQAFGSD